MTTDNPDQVAADATTIASTFHDHLDVCARCREHPFDLCRTGKCLLESSCNGAPEEIEVNEP